MHVMKFTQGGKHVMTIGEPGVNKGSNDPDHLGGPASFYVEPKTNEIFIADGYINKRVVVNDAATGKYMRHWGAYGKRPDDREKYEYPGDGRRIQRWILKSTRPAAGVKPPVVQ
jgi:hypothetical protein